jgi:hypothetical protein
VHLSIFCSSTYTTMLTSCGASELKTILTLLCSPAWSAFSSSRANRFLVFATPILRLSLSSDAGTSACAAAAEHPKAMFRGPALVFESGLGVIGRGGSYIRGSEQLLSRGSLDAKRCGNLLLRIGFGTKVVPNLSELETDGVRSVAGTRELLVCRLDHLDDRVTIFFSLRVTNRVESVTTA